jgi:hypothetical protein
MPRVVCFKVQSTKAQHLRHVVQYSSSINKSTQRVAWSSLLKFNQQKHTTHGMKFNIKVQSTKAHNSLHVVQY